MYDPKQAQLSYLDLFNTKGKTAALQSFIFVITWTIFNKYVLGNPINPLVAFIGFISLALYITWKPKLIRFLRGVLRGAEFRDKGDD